MSQMNIRFRRASNMIMEDAFIDFDKMILTMSRSGVRISIGRMNENAWVFAGKYSTNSTLLADESSDILEKAYVQWSLNKIILGA